MKNLLEPEDLTFKYVKHMTFSTYSHYLHRDDKYNVQWEQKCSRDGHGETGTPKNYYFIDGIDREFTDLETLCECWNEMNNVDDPNDEIVWVKIIRKKPKLK